MELVKAKLKNLSLPAEAAVTVMFNPEEYSVVTNMIYPDIVVPGLSVPLTQFVHGAAQTLALELFLDASNTGISLKDDLDKIRKFVSVHSDLHAPPVCQFQWGETTFDGVMIEFTEKFSLFNESGKILRARLTVKLKAYKPANEQYTDINPASPDRTKTRAAREGDRYDLIAAEEYGDASYWVVLAEANGDERPRLLRAGDIIHIPPLHT